LRLPDLGNVHKVVSRMRLTETIDSSGQPYESWVGEQPRGGRCIHGAAVSVKYLAGKTIRLGRIRVEN
jgi:hypothetical protein